MEEPTATGRRGGGSRQTDLLRSFHLSRNPFVDRTAEKTELDGMSLYVHSDLQGFKPSGESTPKACHAASADVWVLSPAASPQPRPPIDACLPARPLYAETTYIFFGRRGSGKTTIRMQVGCWQRPAGRHAPPVLSWPAGSWRCNGMHATLHIAWPWLHRILPLPDPGRPVRLQMQRAYQLYNDQARASGKTRGHFMIDLARPGHLTGCLRQFQERIGASDDNWDALFSECISCLCICLRQPCSSPTSGWPAPPLPAQALSCLHPSHCNRTRHPPPQARAGRLPTWLTAC